MRQWKRRHRRVPSRPRSPQGRDELHGGAGALRRARWPHRLGDRGWTARSALAALALRAWMAGLPVKPQVAGRSCRASAAVRILSQTRYRTAIAIAAALPEGTRPNLLPRKPLPRPRHIPEEPEQATQRAIQRGQIVRQQRRRAESKSIADKTALAKLPVITAVEIAPGTARRKRAYWQAMADTAIIAAVPASNPAGSADGLGDDAEDPERDKRQKLNPKQQPRQARTVPAAKPARSADPPAPA